MSYWKNISRTEHDSEHILDSEQISDSEHISDSEQYQISAVLEAARYERVRSESNEREDISG